MRKSIICVNVGKNIITASYIQFLVKTHKNSSLKIFPEKKNYLFLIVFLITYINN